MKKRIFAINPGSTSTKIALFDNDTAIYSKNITHDSEQLNQFPEISDQYEFRKDAIVTALMDAEFSLDTVDAFVGRGGGTCSVESGVYTINEKMLEDAQSGKYVKHPANLGSQLARGFAALYHKPSFVVNPPDTDEFCDLARVTGLKGVYRESKIHTLNQKEIGIRYAARMAKTYGEMNLIICHIGGGISVTAHKKGKMIDSNDIAQGDGPMAPTRSGQVPVKDVIKLCFSKQYTEKELLDKVTKTGGLVDHLGTSDARVVSEKVKEGETYATLIYDAMIYQIGKAAGAMAAALGGKVDAIILTGGIAFDTYVIDKLEAMLSFIAPVETMPGEFEMEALAAGTMRVLSGVEKAREYTGLPVWSGFGQ